MAIQARPPIPSNYRRPKVSKGQDERPEHIAHGGTHSVHLAGAVDDNLSASPRPRPQGCEEGEISAEAHAAEKTRDSNHSLSEKEKPKSVHTEANRTEHNVNTTSPATAVLTSQGRESQHLRPRDQRDFDEARGPDYGISSVGRSRLAANVHEWIRNHQPPTPSSFGPATAPSSLLSGLQSGISQNHQVQPHQTTEWIASQSFQENINPDGRAFPGSMPPGHMAMEQNDFLNYPGFNDIQPPSTGAAPDPRPDRIPSTDANDLPPANNNLDYRNREIGASEPFGTLDNSNSFSHRPNAGSAPTYSPAWNTES